MPLSQLAKVGNFCFNLLSPFLSSQVTAFQILLLALFPQRFQISLTIILQQLLKKNKHKNISPSYKQFSDFLKSRTQNSSPLSSTNESEIQNIISSLDSYKSVGPNSIPTKILKLLKNDISSQLADIFNISFSTGVFPTILKLAQVVPVYKKDSKLNFLNYQPISLLSNIENILETLMYNRIYNFFTKNIK